MFDGNRCRRLFSACFHLSLTADRIFTLLQSQEIKQRGSTFHLSSPLTGVPARLGTLRSTVLDPVVYKKTGSAVYFSKDQRAGFDLCASAEAKSCAPSLSLTLSLISSLPPPPFPLHLSISFLFRLLPRLLFAWSQTTARIYRRWRNASGGQTRERLPVCLPYHSLWLI